ncbi:THAP domain-containing protein 1-like [Tachypleus tridentatus]|uniref:THAP domain-containing protein 1-like n=1 Tax=Tachypleus tridentatus TaxID=6853 RepID=UPI003FD6808E
MVTTCVAVGCQNRQDRDPGKSFHRFLTDPERRSRWIAAVKREGWQPTSASRVCSDHFILNKSDDPPFPRLRSFTVPICVFSTE